LLETLGPVEALPFQALYTTPLFEHETLGAFGLADVGQWRSGDLVAATVESLGSWREPPVLEEPQWRRFVLGSQVIAAREGPSETQFGAVAFDAPERDGSFLIKSVSSRYPVRERLTVWTSRNRGLVGRGGGLEVLQFLAKLASGRAPVDLLRESAIESAESLRVLLAVIGA
jgi:hypothetical protein